MVNGFRQLLILLFSIFLTAMVQINCEAQSREDSLPASPASLFRVGVTAGTALYFGDIRTFDYQPVMDPYSELQFVYGIHIQKQLHPLLALRFQYLGGKLAGVQREFKDGSPATRHFAGTFSSLALSGGLNISELFWGESDYRRISLYGYAGGGLCFYRAKLSDYNTNTLINAVGYSADGKTKERPDQSICMPLSLQLNYNFTQKLAMNLEGGYMITFTDKLDAKEMSAPYDGFFSGNIGLTWTVMRTKRKKLSDLPKQEEKSTIMQDVVVNEEVETTLPVVKTEQEGDTVNVIQSERDSLKESENVNETESVSENEKLEIKPIEELNAIPEPAKIQESAVKEEEKENKKEKRQNKEKQKESNSKLALSPEEPNENGFGFLPLVAQLPPEEIKEETPPGLEYRVQIMSTYMRRVPVNDLVMKYQLTNPVKEYYNNGWYQYTAGSFKTQMEASRYKERLTVENGISDAFVVIFKDGNRFYQGKRKSMSFSVVGEETVSYPKPDLEENLIFENVEFRVQVAAMTDRKLPVERIRERLKLNDPVKLDSNKNRYYYTVGSFSNLRQAREYCKLIISRNFVYDAFVIAYVDGMRKTLSEITTKVSPEGERKIETKPGIIFKVQLMALKDKRLTPDMIRDQYDIRENVEETQRDGFYVYSSGNFKTYEDAMKHQTKIRQSGFPEAFVVAYREGKRVSLKEALIEF